MSGSVFPQELEQDPFDPEDFVERLAWRLSQNDTPKPLELHNYFEQEIQNLQALSDQCQARINRLQNQCQEEEEEHFVHLDRLQTENQTAFDELKLLEEKINAVSTKVAHLGDQLQSVDAPRTRANEALQLMRHFNDFISTPEDTYRVESVLFSDPEMLLEKANLMAKLYMVAQELPSSKFSRVQKLINSCYDKTENELIEELAKQHRIVNPNKMKQIIRVLVQFKSGFRSPDAFADVLIVCESQQTLIEEVFPDPDHVMAKLILNIFQGKLKEAIQSKLDIKMDSDRFLRLLADFYAKTQMLVQSLLKLTNGKDKDFLFTLTNNLFAKYLDLYRDLQDLKRDITTRFTTETYGGETFLSEELAISILHDTKQAFQRCQLFGIIQGNSSPVISAAEMAENILDVLIQFLCQEHIDYAVELALYGIPLSEPKTHPELHFFTVVRQVNAIAHLFEKQFTDSILPLVMDTANYDACIQKKNSTLKHIEAKLSNGLDRLINAVAGYVRNILLTEQKKTDFKPESQLPHSVALCTSACTNVVNYLKTVKERICESLDGENVTICLTELAIRFHRILLEQIYQFQYSSAGALMLLCDISEYKKCIDDHFKSIVLARNLFDSLRRLCNLLTIAPESLLTLDISEYGEVDKSVISSFVQLRTDYKTAKLSNDFR